MKGVYIAAILAFITTVIGVVFDNIISNKPNYVLLATPTTNATQVSHNDFRVGIIPGHMENDVGEVCQDASGKVVETEREVNQKIANLVKDNLIIEGYSAQIFSDFDQRLIDYQALVVLVIHTDSCQYINDSATGFKVVRAYSQRENEKSDHLISCLKQKYEFVTGLQFHDSETADMTMYNSFAQVDKVTPIVILDAGFLNLDRDLLTEGTNFVAKGITDGLICICNRNSYLLTNSQVSSNSSMHQEVISLRIT